MTTPAPRKYTVQLITDIPQAGGRTLVYTLTGVPDAPDSVGAVIREPDGVFTITHDDGRVQMIRHSHIAAVECTPVP